MSFSFYNADVHLLIWICYTFVNNFGIENDFEKYLKGFNCCLKLEMYARASRLAIVLITISS